MRVCYFKCIFLTIVILGSIGELAYYLPSEKWDYFFRYIFSGFATILITPSVCGAKLKHIVGSNN